MLKLGRIAPDKTEVDSVNGRTKLTFGNREITVAHIGPHFDSAARAVTPPASVDYSAKAAAGLSQMYLNDRLGDCVIACGAHAADLESGNESGLVPIATDTEIENDYVAFCGPGDQGCAVPIVLNDTKTTGQMLAGKRYQIVDFASVDNTNRTLAEACIVDFGSLTLAILLPNSWYANDASSGFVWDVPPANDTWVAGHCVLVVGYNAVGVQIATWGMIGTITWAAFQRGTIQGSPIVQECYARLGKAWTAVNDKSPSGFNTATLDAALQAAGSGTVPPITPPVNPPTPPTPTPTPTPVPPTPTPPPPTPTPPTPPTPPNPNVATLPLGPGSYPIAQKCHATLPPGKNEVVVTGGPSKEVIDQLRADVTEAQQTLAAYDAADAALAAATAESEKQATAIEAVLAKFSTAKN